MVGTALMTESRELGFVKAGSCSLREQLAQTTLRNVRLQGHSYVELRKDGKREVFFCTLCLAPCYSDSVLYSHLKGSLHTQRLAAAKATLLKSNPWPFNDGVLFFNDLLENGQNPLVISNSEFMLSDTRSNDDGNSLAIVSYDKDLGSYGNEYVSQDVVGFDNSLRSISDVAGSYEAPNVLNLERDGTNHVLNIPGVLCKDKLSNLEVTYMGVAQIAARFTEKEGVPHEFHRIWCEWLGTKDSNNGNMLNLMDHDFAVITFSYSFNLGRKDLLDGIKYLLPPSQILESEDNCSSRNKKRKSFSDPGDADGSLSNQYDSSGEESQSSNSSSTRLLLDGYDNQQLHLRVLKSKSMRREMRRQQRLAAERMCDLCQQKMLPGKDVAALLNRKTGRLACSSRNMTGAFHVFHVSCLIHWVLVCELEMFSKHPDEPKVKSKPRKKAGRKRNSKNVKPKDARKQICSVLCPECQGTGMMVDADELEKPAIPLSEMFKYKIKASEGHKAWMKSPEELQNCSTGFYFPTHSQIGCQDTTSLLKLLPFYRANV